jgi:DNA-binding ferritin-like protein
MARTEAKTRRMAPLATPTNLASNAVQDLSGALTILLADMFALYVKTKNFHWHVSGPHFRDVAAPIGCEFERGMHVDADHVAARREP